MLNLTYELFHFDVNHRLITRTLPIPSRSFVKQFLDSLYNKMSGVGATSTDITNTARSLFSSAFFGFFMLRHTGLDSYNVAVTGSNAVGNAPDQMGIVVGTGTTAVTPVDYKLDTQIAHGTASGQFEHYGCWVSTYAVSSGSDSATFDVERIFHNGSGGNITVNEIGAYFLQRTSSVNFARYCGVRDVLGTSSGTVAVTVLDGEYLKVKYTFKIIV